MPQNIDLKTFLGDNPYYANASEQVAASPASTQPRILTPAESAAFYAENLADSGRVMMPDGTYMKFNPDGTEYRYYETGQPVNPQGGFANAPMKSIDLSTFLGNNPYYQNQTEVVAPVTPVVPAEQPQQPAADPRGVRNPKYEGQMFLPEQMPEDLYLPATPAPAMTGITSQLPPEYQYQIDLINRYRP